ncbi:MAG: two-component regulator propeller domain-containing protein [Bacteroidia bacterium]
MKTHKLFLVFVFLCCVKQTAAQSPFMWHLTDTEGLPSMEVYNMLQDKKGFMWLGTDNGVCRYDGKRFTTFFHPKQRGKAFSFLREDIKGRIWFVNFSGQIFYIENGKMNLFTLFEKEFKSSFPVIQFDSKGQLWVASIGNPLYCYKETSSGWVKIKSLPIGKTNGNMSIDNNDNILLVDFSKGYTYISKGGKIIKTGPKPENVGLVRFIPELNSFCSYKRSVPEVFNITRNQPLNIVSKTGKNSKEDFISDIFIPDTSQLWITTYNGVRIYRKEHNKFTEQISLLPDHAISGVLKDREGNFWISTLKSGIYILPSLQLWAATKENSPMSDSRVFRMAATNNGDLFLAHGNGTISVFNTRTKQFVKQIVFPLKKDIEDVRFNSRNNELYVSCVKTFVYSISAGKVTDPGLSHSSVKRYDFDEAGNVLIATSFGTYLLEYQNALNKSPWYTNYSQGITRVDNQQVIQFTTQRSSTCLINKQDTTIWAGTTNGLLFYHNNVAGELLWKGTDKIFSTDIEQSKDGTIWVSTVQQGLFAIRNRKIVLHLTQKNGLRSDFIRTLSVSGNQLWFATERGVQSYNKGNGKITSFTTDDGLITNDVLDIFQHDGVVYLATSKGFQWFDTDKVQPNKVRPLIYITEFAIQDKDTQLKNNFVLPYFQNNITFRFNGFSFKSGKAMRYSYRLLGLDTNWLNASSEVTFARYPSLPPGDYTFEVKAINADGYESEEPTSISFAVEKPYWQSWWFYLLALLFTSGIVSVIFLIRIRSIRKRNEDERIKADLALEKSMVEHDLRSSQLVSLKAQMNPHFVFNALNSIQEYIMLNEKTLANTYLGKFADLMRMTLDISSRQEVSLQEEVKLLTLYLELEALRFEEKFSYYINIENNVQQSSIYLPPMLIQPYVENAIKHGLLHIKNNRILQVTFAMKSAGLLMATIEDNGIGRKRSFEMRKFRQPMHKSFATGATQKRLELLNYNRPNEIVVKYTDLKDENGFASGTRVELSIPVNIE